MNPDIINTLLTVYIPFAGLMVMIFLAFVRMNATNKRLDDLNIRFTNFHEQMTGIGGDVAIIKKDIRVLQGDMNKVKADIVIVKEDISIMKERISTVEKDIAVMKEDISIMKERISAVEKDIAKTKEDIAKTKEDISIMKERISTMEKDINQLQVDGIQTQQVIASLKEDNLRAEVERKQVRESLEKIQHDQEMLKGAVANLKSHVSYVHGVMLPPPWEEAPLNHLETTEIVRD